jgi:hypothetical protein
MKVENFKNSFLFWVHAGTSSRNLVNQGHFFSQKSFVYVEIMFFKLKTCENSHPKETLLWRDVLASWWSKPIPLEVASTKLHQWIPHTGRFWSSWWIKLHMPALVASSCLNILQNKM